MRYQRLVRLAAILIISCGMALPAGATMSTYYGIDLGVGGPTGAHPNSDAARAAFFSNIAIGSVGTETFESHPLGSFFGGSTTLSFAGAGATGTLVSLSTVAATVLDTFDATAFPISGVRWVLMGTGANQTWFDLTFSSPVYALGFYGTSISNNLGFHFPPARLLINGITLVDVVNVDTSTIPNGSVNYFGVISTTAIQTVRMINTTPGQDYIGLDNITVSAVPEAANSSLFILGLSFVAYRGLRRRSLTRPST